jgi:hypothetical protein
MLFANSALRLLYIPAFLLVGAVFLVVLAHVTHRFVVKRYLAIARRWHGRVFDEGVDGEIWVEIPLPSVNARLQFGERSKAPSFVKWKAPFPDAGAHLKVVPINLVDRMIRLLKLPHPATGNAEFDSAFVVIGDQLPGGGNLLLSPAVLEAVVNFRWRQRCESLNIDVMDGEVHMLAQGVEVREPGLHGTIAGLQHIYLTLVQTAQALGKPAKPAEIS